MRYARPPRLAHVTSIPEDDPESHLRVYVRPLPEGPTLMLEGVGALIWSLASHGIDDVVTAVALEVGEPAPNIRTEVEAYLRRLVGQGLLTVPNPLVVDH